MVEKAVVEISQFGPNLAQKHVLKRNKLHRYSSPNLEGGILPQLRKKFLQIILWKN